MPEFTLDRLRRELEDSSPDVWRRILIALLEERQDESTFQEAKQVLEAALAEGETAELLHQYGYVHQVKGRMELRTAVRCYERSLELDPAVEKTKSQLTSAYAALGETETAIELCVRRLAAAPDDLSEHRCLAHAYLAAGRHEEAAKVVDAGLRLAPDDAKLLEQRGTVLEARGLADDALAVWQRAIELDGEFVDPRYSRVFLLQRLGRDKEAAVEWEGIIRWLLERGFEVEAEWPKRELARLRDRAS